MPPGRQAVPTGSNLPRLLMHQPHAVIVEYDAVAPVAKPGRAVPCQGACTVHSPQAPLLLTSIISGGAAAHAPTRISQRRSRARSARLVF